MNEDPIFDPLAPVKEEKVRIQKPRVKLDNLREPLLELHSHVQDIPYSGLDYLDEFIKIHQMWAHSIYPGMRYEDFCKDVDKLSTSREWKGWHFEQIREEMGILTTNIEVDNGDADITDDAAPLESLKSDFMVTYDGENIEAKNENEIPKNIKAVSESNEAVTRSEESILSDKRKKALELLRKRRMEE
eukprot:NODE_314_length_11212_cov_0.272924.p6 type:complete len:188 gc:universal NODE_314_length_11212_cov_0.272924:10523-9960(-)